MSRTGVILSNLGGPDVPSAIEPFLYNLFVDPLILSIRPGFLRRFVARKISKSRAPKVAKDYALIGGASPLPRLTDDQARGLERVLERRAPGRFATAVAMRYWKPTTDDAIAALRAKGCSRFFHLPLYPQESRATTESSSREIRRVLERELPGTPFGEIRSYYDRPGYVAAVRRTVDEGLAAMRAEGIARPHVLFSAHGLPESFQKSGDPYVGQIQTTRALVAAGLDCPTTLSFQSRVGPVAWVKPYTDVTIAQLASEGVRELLVVPLGFVSDHFETLFEIDIMYADLARAKGMTHVRRAPSLNDREDFLALLADLVFEKNP